MFYDVFYRLIYRCVFLLLERLLAKCKYISRTVTPDKVSCEVQVSDGNDNTGKFMSVHFCYISGLFVF